jgi:hypothetical protein
LITAKDFDDSVKKRMEIYRNHAGGSPIKAYVNIGGGTVSAGRRIGKKMFRPGLNLRPPRGVKGVDGVMPRLAQEGVAVVHLIQIVELAERYGLPIAPKTMPEPGEGNIFKGPHYNKWLAVSVLVVIILSLYGFIRSDIGFRLLQTNYRRSDGGYPEPAI